jgi:hypothetical protein
MKTILFLLIPCFFVTDFAYAQEKDRTNSIYGEFIGNGLVYSAGYEKVLIHTDKDWLAAKVGICLFPRSAGNAHTLFKSLPIELVSRGVHRNIELGLGITPFSQIVWNVISPTENIVVAEESLAYAVISRIGYHSTPGKRGMYWNGAIMPRLFDSTRDKNFALLFGIGVGKSF